MAIWQYDVFLIPNSILSRVPLSQLQKAMQSSELHCAVNLPSDYEHLFTRMFGESHSFAPEWRIWGKDDGNRCDVISEDGNVEVMIRLDLTRLGRDLMHQVLQLAQTCGCVLLDREGRVFEPKEKPFLDHLKTSDAFRFISDPEKYLHELSRESIG